MAEKKDIYSLSYHEEMQIVIAGRNCTIKRIAGGWLYIQGDTFQMVFVPYNNEFSR